MFGLMNMLYLVQKSNIPWADNSLACSGWLNLKTWFLPKMTLEPVFNVIGWSNFLPFTKQMAPGLGSSFTTPELGMEKNVTLFYVILFLLPASMFFSTFLAFLALRLSTVTRKFPVSSNGWIERLKRNFYSLGYYCTPNLSIHQNST